MRANRPGQKSVMWRNETFNCLFRREEEKILKKLFASKLTAPLEILEYGCGVGIFCMILIKVFPNAHVTGIDFPEMISVAKRKNSHERITYISSEAENYLASPSSYDLIVSSGAITAIINKDCAYTVLKNSQLMLRDNGELLFIDPFHKYWPLSRKSLNAKEIITILTNNPNINLSTYSGISFWPIRMIIANSNFPKQMVVILFLMGEKLLSLLGKRQWSDYKVLLFSHVQK